MRHKGRLMGFLRHLEVLPKARKAACNGSPCFGIKPRRLFLEELLPSRAPLRFVDGAKIRLVFVPTKFRLKKQPTFCPLGLFVSKTAYFLSITPKFPYTTATAAEWLALMVSLAVGTVPTKDSPANKVPMSTISAISTPKTTTGKSSTAP